MTRTALLLALLCAASCAHSIGNEQFDDDGDQKGDDNDQQSGGVDAAPPVDAFIPLDPCDAGNDHIVDPGTGDCFVLFESGQAWDGASAACTSAGGALADFESGQQNQLVTAMVGTQQVWIGATDAASEGNWQWTGGAPFDFDNWRAGEPNNGSGNEDCAVLEGDRGGLWDDRTCTEPRPFVCRISQ